MIKNLNKVRNRKNTHKDNAIVLFAIMTVFVCALAIANISDEKGILYTNMAFADTAHTSLYEWGAYGIGGDGKFSHPQFITVDKNNGDTYVTDLGNKRVQKFDSNGVFLTTWGESGHANGQFNYPSGIATDGTFVYVADRDLNRVQKFDLNGTYISQWGERGKIEGSLSMPNDVAASDDGYVYVVDTGNYRVQKFTTEGEFVLSFGGSGIEYGKFITPHGIDISDDDGSVYVSDRGNKRIDHYMANGTYIRSYEFEASGSFQFVPESIEIASNSMMYITNAHSQNVMYLNLSESSRPLAVFEQYGPFHTERMVFPTDITLGIDGQLYVIDSLDHTIYAYKTPLYGNVSSSTIVSTTQQSSFDNNSTTNNKETDTKDQHTLYYDTTPPVITAPPNITVDATGMLSTVDIGIAKATDDYQIIEILTNAPKKFPIGTTQVTWTAFDEARNTAKVHQFVTVLACGLPQSAYNTIHGTNANDVINGTPRADLIFGQAGKDIIKGGAGNDCIFGEGDDDVIEGGLDNDYIYGGTGNDILKGDTGADIMYGGTGGDFLDGGKSSWDKCEQSDGLDLTVRCEIFITN